MPILKTGQIFSSGDQVTSQKLMDIADLATFDDPADGSTIIVNSQTYGISGGDGKLKVPSGGITSNELASDSVTSAKIKDSSVTASKVADDAITTSKIADNAVTFAKLSDINTAKVIGRTTDGNGTPEEVSILDDDSMATASDTTLATSESIKAYVDTYGVDVFAKAFIDTSGNVTRSTNVASASNVVTGSGAYNNFTINLTTGPTSEHSSYNVQVTARVSSISTDTAHQIVYVWNSSTQVQVQVSGSTNLDGISFLIIK